jgi:signal transduction histidine kinase
LTVLHTRIQLLARRFDDGDAHEAKEQIDALAADTRALGEVIEDLLASASMATNGVARDRVDVSAVVAAVRESMAEHADSTDVTLVVERDDGRVAADLVVLGSAAALRGGTITIDVGRRGPDVVIDVRDDGVGIESTALETLFTRFSHGQSHTSTAGRQRYGIGLALVREIVLAHRGGIGVTQTPGGGATFTLTVPAAPPA